MNPCPLSQLELVWLPWIAWANETLEFGRIVSVFDVGAVTIGQSEVFDHVLHVAIRAFHL